MSVLIDQPVSTPVDEWARSTTDALHTGGVGAAPASSSAPAPAPATSFQQSLAQSTPAVSTPGLDMPGRFPRDALDTLAENSPAAVQLPTMDEVKQHVATAQEYVANNETLNRNVAAAKAYVPAKEDVQGTLGKVGDRVGDLARQYLPESVVGAMSSVLPEGTGATRDPTSESTAVASLDPTITSTLPQGTTNEFSSETSNKFDSTPVVAVANTGATPTPTSINETKLAQHPIADDPALARTNANLAAMQTVPDRDSNPADHLDASKLDSVFSPEQSNLARLQQLPSPSAQALATPTLAPTPPAKDGDSGGYMSAPQATTGSTALNTAPSNAHALGNTGAQAPDASIAPAAGTGPLAAVGAGPTTGAVAREASSSTSSGTSDSASDDNNNSTAAAEGDGTKKPKKKKFIQRMKDKLHHKN